jgi:UDP-3-O-[3-hydroxymyristoyl] glucosamine N-acyltransferase
MTKISVQKIAIFLNQDIKGNSTGIFDIYYPASIKDLKQNALYFLTTCDESIIQGLNNLESVLVIVEPEYHTKLQCSHIISQNPKLDFAKVVNHFFTHPSRSGIANSVILGENSALGENISIGEYSIIGNNVTIDDNTSIGSFCFIGDDTNIGKDCVIESHCMIGQPGWSSVTDIDGKYIAFPHVGNVVILSNVHIGSFTTIDKGTLQSTVICSNVRINDKVHIAHNVRVNAGSKIAALCALSGGTVIGKNCYLGPGVITKGHLEIVDDVIIGTNTVVLRSITKAGTYVNEVKMRELT